MTLSKYLWPVVWLLLLNCGLLAADNTRPTLDLHGDPLPAGAIARYGTIRFHHAESVVGVAFVSGGKLLASTGQDGTVRLWDPADGREVHRWVVPQCGALAVSPDGRVLAAAGHYDRHVWLYDVMSRKESERLETKDWVLSVALSPDGKYLASGYYPGGLSLWDARTGEKLQDLAKEQAAYALAFSPDGKTLAVAGDWGYIGLWDVAARKLLRELKGHQQVVWSIAFSPDSKTLASVGQDETFRLWDCTTGKEIRRFLGHQGRITAVAFAPDGKTVASGGQDDRTVRLWDPSTARELAKFPDHTGSVLSLAFSPDGRLLASTTGHTIRLWDLKADRELLHRTGHEMAVYSVAYSPDGQLLLSAGEDQTVRVWDAASGKQLRQFACFRHNAQAVFSPDGKTLAVGVGDYNTLKVALRDWPSGQQRAELKGSRPFAFSPSGDMFAVAVHNSVSLWDQTTAKVTLELSDRSEVEWLAFSADGRALAAVNNWGGWLVWDLPGGKLRLRSPGPDKVAEPLYAVAFSPDGRWLATGGVTGTIRLADLTAGGAVHELPGHLRPGVEPQFQDGNRVGQIRSLAFSPDGKMLASAGEDDCVILWELVTGERRVGLKGHERRVNSVAFAPDGRTLASGGGDGQVLAWEMWAQGRAGAAELTPRALEDLWAELASRDAGKAFRAMREFVSAPKDALPFLRQRLRPAAREVPPAVAQLILELEDNRFEVRERAEQELCRRGDESEVARSRALAGTPSLEVRRRLEQVGEKLRRAGPSAEWLRSCRAVEVLEYLGTAEARGVLRQLAGGAPEAGLTREATDALRRLRGRTGTVPGSE